MVLKEQIRMTAMFALLFWPAFVTWTLAQGECQPHKRVIKEVTKLFSEMVEFVPAFTQDKSDSLGVFLHPGDCLYRITEDDQLLGYLISTSAKGRFEYFDYSVIFSKEKAIAKVMVTVYRSDHGAAICQKTWLSQFEGYHGGELVLGSDIDAVSGGTLSANSLVRDVQRCHLLISSLFPE